MEELKHFVIEDFVAKADISSSYNVVQEKIEAANKKIDKLNKKISEVEKLIPNYKVGDKLITKNLRVLTIEKIDYKKKLGFRYGGKLNFQPDKDYMLWFNEDEFLTYYTNTEDYEYRLVRRIKELENEIAEMKKV